MKSKDIKIGLDASLFDALKKMDQINRKLLLVAKQDFFKSVISIGDIQRAILNGHSLETPIEKVLRAHVFVGKIGDSRAELIKRLLDERVEFIPILNQEGDIQEVLFWEDYSKNGSSD